MFKTLLTLIVLAESVVRAIKLINDLFKTLLRLIALDKSVIRAIRLINN